MDGTGADVDVSAVNALFDELRLSGREMRGAVRQATRSALLPVAREARRNLLAGVDASDKVAMRQAVRTLSYKRKLGSYVTIGTRKQSASARKRGRKNYSPLLHLFENGTQERFRGKGRMSKWRGDERAGALSTGRLKPLRFLARAKVSREGDAVRSVAELVLARMRRIGERKR